MSSRVRSALAIISGIVFFLLASALIFDEVAGPDALATIVTPTLTPHFSDTAVLWYADLFGSTSTRDHFVRIAGTIRSAPRQHALMHAVGDMLYTREGTLRALAMCPDDYATGCLHEVVGLTLYEDYGIVPDGQDAGIRKLFSECVTLAPDKRAACAHAIGHGLMYVARYDPRQIPRALAQCDVLHAHAKFLNYNHNCYVGVFMEYNEHNMQDYAPRTIDWAHPYAPCDALSTPFHNHLCIAWLVPFFHGIVDDYHFGDGPVGRLGKLCRNAPLGAHPLCFLSIGRSLSFDQAITPEKAWHSCGLASENDYPSTAACAYEIGAMIDERLGGSFRSQLCATAKDPEACRSYTEKVPNELVRKGSD